MKFVKEAPGSYPELAGIFGYQEKPTKLDRLIANLLMPSGEPVFTTWLKGESKMFGPDSVSPTGWRNVAADGVDIFNRAGGSLPSYDTINGTPAMSNGEDGYYASDAARLNVDEITFMGVFERAVSESNLYLLGPGDSSGNTGTSAPTILVRPENTFSLYIGGAVVVTPTIPGLDDPFCVTVTMSAERGRSLRFNGVEIIATGAGIPLATDVFRIFSGFSTTGRYEGKAGEILIAKADLTAPRYSSQLAEIESGLMAKYGIS